jgi:hypothetical protein
MERTRGMRRRRCAHQVVGGVTAAVLLLFALLIDGAQVARANATATPSCKFTPSLLNAPLRAKFKKTVRTSKNPSAGVRIRGVTYKITIYQCGYTSPGLNVVISMKVPFTKAMQQDELEGTRTLANNFAEDGAKFEAYAPLAADDAFFYNGPVPSETHEVSVSAYAYINGAQVILATSYYEGKQSFATVGKALKVAVTHVRT